MRKYFLSFFMACLTMATSFAVPSGTGTEASAAVPGIRFENIEVEAVCNAPGDYTYTYDLKLCEVWTAVDELHIYIAPDPGLDWIYAGLATQVGSDDFHYTLVQNSSVELNPGNWIMLGKYSYTDPADIFDGDGNDYCSSRRNFVMPPALGDCDPCEPADIVVTVDDQDVTSTLSYTIPCGQTCINVAATNVENAVYNTTDPVLTDLEGLFCVTDPDMTSFTAYITGQDSCGNDVNIAIDVQIEQDCGGGGDGCENFDESTGNWETSAAGISISSNGPTADGTPYLRGTDGASSTGSWIFNETDYTGDFGADPGTCICWDYKVFDDSDPGSPGMHPRIRIYQGTATAQTAWATFVATNITITENDDWVRVCAAPILPVNAGDPLPSAGDGEWVMSTGSTAADWNALISNIDGIAFVTDVAGSSTQNEVIGIDNLCVLPCEEECSDEPYIEPYWDLCESNNVCELDSWPVRVLDDDGSPLLLIDGYTFVWDDGSTSDVRYGVTAGQTVSVTVTYPDGCEYYIEYLKECCEGGIVVEFDECPEQEIVIELERQLEQNKSLIPAQEYNDMFQALQTYRANNVAKAASDDPRADTSKDCDPCEIGTVIVFVIDIETGLPITNFQTITITNNDTGITVPIGQNYFQVYVDVSYTVTVTVLDPEGHTCEYSYDFIYDCEAEPCSDLMAPTNLQVSGTTLSWDPVPGAVSYIVSSPGAGGPVIFCDCEFQVSMAPQTTPTNSLTLTGGLAEACFAWQVTAVCADGSRSQLSDAACYGAAGGHGDTRKVFTNTSITPNPTQGDLNLNVTVSKDTPVTISIFDFYGNLVKQFQLNATSGDLNTLQWNAQGLLSRGMYFVRFQTDTETVNQKLIVN